MEAYKELLLQLNSFFLWDKPWYSSAIMGGKQAAGLVLVNIVLFCIENRYGTKLFSMTICH